MKAAHVYPQAEAEEETEGEEAMRATDVTPAPSNRASVEALLQMLSQIETLISTTAPMPENRSARCLELLKAAKALATGFAGDIEKGRP